MRAFKEIGLALLALLGACAPGLWQDTLRLRRVTWNRQDVPVGRVAAVAEMYDDTVVASDQGLLVFTGGVLLPGAQTGTRSWRGAAVVPAADKSGEWLLLLDGQGRLLRLRDRRTLEDVGDRYGLRGEPIEGLAALGDGLVGFALPTGVAVADGKRVARYSAHLPGLAGGGGRAVALVHGGVRVFEPDGPDAGDEGPTGGRVREYWVPDAVAAVFDGKDRLVVASADALYREDKAGGLEKIYDIPWRRAQNERIWGLAAAGTGVWVAIGERLALLREGTLLTGPPGVLHGSERLSGAASGDVWVLGGEQGLWRYGPDTGHAAAEERWRQSVLPIFTRSCSICHLPGGSAGIDLSNYQAWVDRRSLIEQRVLRGKPRPMPPAGVGTLLPADRDAVKVWLDNPF